ncbi:unnamed protein product [Clavelina lepadiformis]|uniref:Death domain-containing protein n=1 Tax=Clavelina lepadiformis TaxID=159417 RepID=A0ABP0GQP9_CLALP
MNAELFDRPQRLLNRWESRINSQDQIFLAGSLEHCISVTWDVFASLHFKLNRADVENILSDYRDHRSKQILAMVERYCITGGEDVTPGRISQILEEAKLISILQMWWQHYRSDEQKNEIKQYLDRRKDFISKLVKCDISRQDWTRFLMEIKVQDKENKIIQKNPDNDLKQRMDILELWAEEVGYDEASTSAIITALHRSHLSHVVRKISGSTSSDVVDTRSQPSPVQSVQVDGLKHDIGLLYDEADVGIARRISQRMKAFGYNVCLFDDYVMAGGTPKTKKSSELCDNSLCVMWIATDASINSEGYDKFNRQICHFNSIKKQPDRGAFRFVVLKPKKHLDLKLPDHLAAHSSVLEDEQFQERISVTMKRLRKKQSRKS